MIRKVSGAFTGGAIGGLGDSIGIWVLGKTGITDLLGVSMKPDFPQPLALPADGLGWHLDALAASPLVAETNGSSWLRVFSLVPSAMMLFVVFPNMGKGLLGLGFGNLTPMVVIRLNLIYGIVAALWFKATI